MYSRLEYDYLYKPAMKKERFSVTENTIKLINTNRIHKLTFPPGHTPFPLLNFLLIKHAGIVDSRGQCQPSHTAGSSTHLKFITTPHFITRTAA